MRAARALVEMTQGSRMGTEKLTTMFEAECHQAVCHDMVIVEGIEEVGLCEHHLLPILMTAEWFVNQLLMHKPANEDPQLAQQRKMMMFLPLLFGFMMYGYGAGLSLYWLTSSLLGIVESRLIKKWLPPRKKEPVPAT